VLELFDASVRLAEWTGAPYMIENPVSTVSSYWRKPDYSFDPCDYGGFLNPNVDAHTKKMCLWTGNGFVMPKTKNVTPIEGMHPVIQRRGAIYLDKHSELGIRGAFCQLPRA
jgi:hypothetical protein